ncbi:putative Ig domain-containing protein [Streptomyces halobius]|uniref:Ig domain-containing protein n=1 Tax=Streptomyces halobius TaxID=2879846 RepID=A0ABY4MC12_9ACTN|nr:putative Ig domain-containing protein [Streptomyces halobius]UQA95314.1 putative Ig domain-containing protein [Streptomyces halobius]
MSGFGGARGFGRRRGGGDGAPVELRFIDLLLIIIATLMFLAVLLSLVSANTPAGEQQAVKPPKIEVATTKAPDALAGSPYELTLAAVGGVAPYRWERTAGQLPKGLRLTSNGVLTGRAEQPADGPGPVRATVRVEDSKGQRAERTLSLTVRRAAEEGAERPRLRVVSKTVAVPEGKKDEAYPAHRFAADAGSGPYTWEPAGALPGGMRLSRTGELSGKPAEEGVFTFGIRVKDSTGLQAEQQVRLVVGEVRPEEDGDVWDAPWWLLALGAIGALVVLQILKMIFFGRRSMVTPPVQGVFRR